MLGAKTVVKMKPELTFDQWVEKVFAGEPPSFDWMWENALDPTKAEWLVTYPTRLFEEPEFLIDRYSDEQLRKGFWNLPNSWELRDSIWGKELPWTLRKSCIQSMVPLFEKFFSRNPLGDTCYMWWDALRYFGDDGEERVVDEIFLALKKTLFLDSLDCQGAALHGLGHLDHSEKRSVINKYLKEHPDLDPTLNGPL